jgi:hypothetical protein
MHADARLGGRWGRCWKIKAVRKKAFVGERHGFVTSNLSNGQAGLVGAGRKETKREA